MRGITWGMDCGGCRWIEFNFLSSMFWVGGEVAYIYPVCYHSRLKKDEKMNYRGIIGIYTRQNKP